jgi:transcriptional regulator with XRE-family HTH domain
MERTITPEDLAAAARLKALWEQKQKERGFTQETAADELGITQGAVSQYINGGIALGIAATIKFARFLGCEPSEIRPDYEHLLVVGLSREAIELAEAWETSTDTRLKKYIQQLIFEHPQRAVND